MPKEIVLIEDLGRDIFRTTGDERTLEDGAGFGAPPGQWRPASLPANPVHGRLVRQEGFLDRLFHAVRNIPMRVDGDGQ